MTIDELQKLIQKTNDEIDNLDDIIDLLDSQIENLEDERDDSYRQINTLKQELRVLEEKLVIIESITDEDRSNYVKHEKQIELF